MTWLRANLMTAATLALAVLLALQTWRLHTEQLAHQALIASHAAQIADQQRQLAEAHARARNTEQHLVTQAAQTEETKNAEIAAARATADTLRRRLRDAAATSALVSATAPATCLAGAAAGGDRSEFPESLGDALVSEAERADKLRAALAQCTSQYNAARDALAEFGKR
jgi:hypothetical protein